MLHSSRGEREAQTKQTKGGLAMSDQSSLQNVDLLKPYDVLHPFRQPAPLMSGAQQNTRQIDALIAGLSWCVFCHTYLATDIMRLPCLFRTASSCRDLIVCHHALVKCSATFRLDTGHSAQTVLPPWTPQASAPDVEAELASFGDIAERWSEKG